MSIAVSSQVSIMLARSSWLDGSWLESILVLGFPLAMAWFISSFHIPKKRLRITSIILSSLFFVSVLTLVWFEYGLRN
jgi:hypothetical protein